MANWSSPHIWSVGEEVTAALLNQYQRDNLQYLFDRLKLLTGTYAGFKTSQVTLTPGTWLLLILFTSGNDLFLKKNGVTQISNPSPGSSAPTLIWSAVVTAPSEVWTANQIGGADTPIYMYALRVAV
jgi:hypothetical protein